MDDAFIALLNVAVIRVLGQAPLAPPEGIEKITVGTAGLVSDFFCEPPHPPAKMSSRTAARQILLRFPLHINIFLFVVTGS